MISFALFFFFSIALSERVSISKFRYNKRCAFSYTFDDGAQSASSQIFDEFDYRASYYIIVGRILSRVNGTASAIPTWDDWRRLAKRGHEVGSHTMTHPNMLHANESQLHFEFSESRRLIEANLGTTPLTFAFPYNYMNERTLDICRRYYVAARQHAFDFTQYYHHPFERFRPRMQQVLDNEEWFIANLHNLGTTGYVPITQHVLRQHLAFLRAHDNVTWVDTFFAVYCYVHLRMHTKITIVEDSLRRVRFRTSCDSCDRRCDVPLTFTISRDATLVDEAHANIVDSREQLIVQLSNNLILVEFVPFIESVVVVEW
jgi:hypothetical protein